MDTPERESRSGIGMAGETRRMGETTMRQKLDEVRTLAVALFEAAQQARRKQPPEIWGDAANRKFRDLPSESVDVLDAMAMEAIKRLRHIRCDKQNKPDADIKVPDYITRHFPG
jgi:hypothetical protein